MDFVHLTRSWICVFSPKQLRYQDGKFKIFKIWETFIFDQLHSIFSLFRFAFNNINKMVAVLSIAQGAFIIYNFLFSEMLIPLFSWKLSSFILESRHHKYFLNLLFLVIKSRRKKTLIFQFNVNKCSLNWEYKKWYCWKCFFFQSEAYFKGQSKVMFRSPFN